jgi:hypothetical protein
MTRKPNPLLAVFTLVSTQGFDSNQPLLRSSERCPPRPRALARSLNHDLDPTCALRFCQGFVVRLGLLRIAYRKFADRFVKRIALATITRYRRGIPRFSVRQRFATFSFSLILRPPFQTKHAERATI